MPYCRQSENPSPVAAIPETHPGLSALVSGSQVSWDDLGKPLVSDKGLEVAVGADGSVFKVDLPVAPVTDAGTISRFTPHEAANKWDGFGGLAQRLAVDPKGHPWTIHAAQGLHYYAGLNSGSQHVWTRIPNAPTRPVDIAINSLGTLVVLSKATDTSTNARVFYWTTSIYNPQPASTWIELPGQKGVRLAADSLNAFRIVNNAGAAYLWDAPNSEWDLVTAPPLNDIAMGKTGRTWATLKSPAGGDTIAYKDPAGSLLGTTGWATNISAHISSDPWIIHPDGYPRRGTTARTWETSFESLADFTNLYWAHDTLTYKADQKFDSSVVRHGGRSHKAWITGALAANYNNSLVHRAYPILSYTRTAGGIFNGPCLVSMWVYLDTELADFTYPQIDDWFSFATFTATITDTWIPVATVNLGPAGRINTYHTPVTNQGDMTFFYDDASDPSGAKKFPKREWVRLDMLVYLHSTQGYIMIWQNKIHVVTAHVQYGNGTLAQAHFGMYASPAVSQGVVYNDKLQVIPVADSVEALKYVNWPW